MTVIHTAVNSLARRHTVLPTIHVYWIDVKDRGSTSTVICWGRRGVPCPEALGALVMEEAGSVEP